MSANVTQDGIYTIMNLRQTNKRFKWNYWVRSYFEGELNSVEMFRRSGVSKGGSVINGASLGIVCIADQAFKNKGQNGTTMANS